MDKQLVNESSSRLLCLHGSTRPSPLCESFTQKMRPFLDAVDRLRSMGVMEEGISLPTIVVVGDQSSGKSSVLESLSGVELPKGQGIVTRVPLILRLKGSHDLSNITISYNSKFRNQHIDKVIDEIDIPAALASATDELAGTGKGITDNPITLNVSRPGVPDLTLVDLPGITRVPVQGQPDDIYEKIHALIGHYIKPEETIILNVLSAAMDFSVCESIRMSRQVDRLGKRTLAVVTKVDMCPEGLLEKITNDAVKIGLGYICVRNRTAKEDSFEEAAEAEEELFTTHSELRKLSKSMVGVKALASRLIQLQTQSIAGVLPRILNQIESSMGVKRRELEQLSGNINTLCDASVAFFHISSSVKTCLQDILQGSAGDEDCPLPKSDSVPNKLMPYTAKLHKKFESFASRVTLESGKKLLLGDANQGYTDCIRRLLSESLGNNLPSVVPQAVIEKMVRELIDSIADTCTSELPSFVHEAAREVALFVIAKHAAHFPNLRRLYTTIFERALGDCKSRCCRVINRFLDMEKAIIYTATTEYNVVLGKLLQVSAKMETIDIEGFGAVNMASLSRSITRGLDGDAIRQAVCSVLAYWMVLSRRLADHIPRELRFSFNEALLDAAGEVVGHVLGNRSGLSIEEVMTEQPEVAQHRQRLRTSLDMLSKSKDLISRVLLLGDYAY
eukprot:c22498_g1_i1 orf=21-2045(+)